jgi:exosortase J
MQPNTQTQDRFIFGFVGLDRRIKIAVLACLLVLAGVVSIYPLVFAIWTQWSSDPLRSLGMYLPFVSFIGVVAAWRGLGWRMQGSWWGIPVVGFSILLARVVVAVSSGGVTDAITIAGVPVPFLHPGVAVFAYGAGCVLTFGGTPLLRRAFAPLCLLLCVNPVPYGFNDHFDLPLQFLSANTARGFAHLIGLHPTGVELKMMFAPDFGMMIVPGCNGIRGAVTLGYLTLIAAYARGLKLSWVALLAGTAVLLGYALNLIRLCCLVVYYRIGIHFPSIQPYGVTVDYLMGSALFLAATFGLGVSVYFFEKHAPRRQPPPVPAAQTSQRPLGNGPLIAFAAVVLLSLLTVPTKSEAERPSLDAALAALPRTVGPYKLVKTESEYLPNGPLAMVTGEYVADGQHDPIKLGLWLGNDDHLISRCRRAQGQYPALDSSLTTESGSQTSMQMLVFGYDDGTRQEFDAETTCDRSGCSQTGKTLQEDIRTVPQLLRGQNRALTRIPILLQRHWPDDGLSLAQRSPLFQASIQQFTAGLDLNQIASALLNR